MVIVGNRVLEDGKVLEGRLVLAQEPPLEAAVGPVVLFEVD